LQPTHVHAGAGGPNVEGVQSPKRIRVLITGPALRDEGGVAGYYNSLMPGFHADPRLDVEYFELGSTTAAFGRMHPIADQVRFSRALRQFRPDLVHVNPSLTLRSLIRDGLIMDQALRGRIPVVVFFHGWQDETEAVVDGPLRWPFRMTYGRANGFLVLGTRFRDKLLGWGITAPIELETTTVPETVMENFSLADKLASLRGETIAKILFLARLEPEKGVIETLEAVASLLRDGANVSLTIAGDGPAMGDVRRFVANNAWLGDRVAVVGYVRGEAKRALLTSHHIYSLPSDYREGMPTSVLEAMALGMPIVTCAVGGLADFFEDGRMGHLVPGRSAPAIAEKLALLVNDREAAATMAEYNHRYALRRFLSPDVARRLGDFYARIVHDAAGTAAR
jgi:glycosyltransferase involved in cell wall biosynthesis